MTTKILALTDALGNLVRFVLLPGQRFDTVGVAPLIEGIEFGALLGDKVFTTTPSLPTSTNAAPRLSSPSIHAVPSRSSSISKCINGAISSKTSSVN